MGGGGLNIFEWWKIIKPGKHTGLCIFIADCLTCLRGWTYSESALSAFFSAHRFNANTATTCIFCSFEITKRRSAADCESGWTSSVLQIIVTLHYSIHSLPHYVFYGRAIKLCMLKDYSRVLKVCCWICIAGCCACFILSQSILPFIKMKTFSKTVSSSFLTPMTRLACIAKRTVPEQEWLLVLFCS